MNKRGPLCSLSRGAKAWYPGSVKWRFIRGGRGEGEHEAFLWAGRVYIYKQIYTHTLYKYPSLAVLDGKPLEFVELSHTKETSHP